MSHDDSAYITPSDISITKLIKPTILKNTNELGKIDDNETTVDRIFVRSLKEVREDKNLSERDIDIYCIPTDFSIFLGTEVNSKTGRTASTLLRSKSDHHDSFFDSLDEFGAVDIQNTKPHKLAIPISMNWDIDYAEQHFLNLHTLEHNKNLCQHRLGRFRKTLDTFIKFGEFPQSWAGEKTSKLLEYELSKGTLFKTKKTFDIPTYIEGPAEEYIYNNQKYVRIKTSNKDRIMHFKGHTVKPKEYMWFKVEPILWHISNYDNLPFPINRNGSIGWAKDNQLDNVIKLTSFGCLLGGIHLGKFDWNSELNPLRNFLNGYDSDKTSGYYKNNNFFQMAFDCPAPCDVPAFGEEVKKYAEKIEDAEKEVPSSVIQIASDLAKKGAGFKIHVGYDESGKPITVEDKSSPFSSNYQQDNDTSKKQPLNSTEEEIKPTKINVEEPIIETKQGEDMSKTIIEPQLKDYSDLLKNTTIDNDDMTIQEQIEFYVNNGISFMLHGLSGIGKSSRVRNASNENFTCLPLSDGMLPEEVKGKTIYPANGQSYWEPPHWYTQIYEACEKDKDTIQVLFIDELTNVDPHVQALVFDLIQYKTIAPNLGALPKNCVVVAAGNEKKDSAAAYYLAEPLFRKFAAHIYIPLSVDEFIKYGTLPKKDDPTRPQVHPLITSFVAAFGKKVLHSAYVPKEDTRYVIDPRGWEQVSDVIYASGNKVVRSLIENKLGNSLTSSLIAFAKTPLITLNDVLTGDYDERKIPSNVDQQLALALSFRMVSKENLSIICGFISKHLHKEVLKTFLTEWIGKDDERALFVQSMLNQGLKYSTPKSSDGDSMADDLSHEEDKHVTKIGRFPLDSLKDI